MVDVGEDGSVKVKVRLGVKPSLYREWTKGLMQKLDAVSTTYEDVAEPCTLINPAASMAMGGMPNAGARPGLPPEYAAMAAQVAEMGYGAGAGMDYGRSMPLHPFAQMDVERASGRPSISFSRDEFESASAERMRRPDGRDPGKFTLRVIRPGQDAVWKRNPGDVELRTRVYTLEGDKAVLVRRFISDAMKTLGNKTEKKDASPKASETGPGLVNPSGIGSVVLSVSIFADKDVLAQTTMYPSNHEMTQEERMDEDASSIVYPLSVAAFSTSHAWERADKIVICPFLISDSAHCYQDWEDWVSVGVLSEADLDRVTDIRTKVFFR